MSTITIDIIKKNIPFYSELQETEKSLNCKIFIVGGAVRDILLNKNIKDIDITVENVDYITLAKNIAKKLKAYPAPFKDNMRISKNGFEIDVSKLRGKNIIEDISLRDFTINNMALTLDGTFYGSDNDLNNKIIKAVYNGTFDSDPLRIIRCFRFVSTLGFNIDNDTLYLAISKKPLIKNVAKERITDEIRKIFNGPFLEKSVTLINKYNILQDILQCDLNNDFLISAKNETNKFSLLLYLWCSNIKSIKNLSLTAKELKEVEFYDNINVGCLENMSNDELSFYVYKENKLIDDIVIYVKTVSKNDRLSTRLLKAFESLDFSKSSAVSGEVLIKAGFKPSPVFSHIIEKTGFLLASNKLNKDNFIDYIYKNWGDNAVH